MSTERVRREISLPLLSARLRNLLLTAWLACLTAQFALISTYVTLARLALLLEDYASLTRSQLPLAQPAPVPFHWMFLNLQLLTATLIPN